MCLCLCGDSLAGRRSSLSRFMAATQSQGPDRTTEEVAAEPDKVKDQLHSSIPDRSISSNSSQDIATMGHSRETTSQPGSFISGGGCPLYPPNVYAPQAQAFFYRGFENANGEWDEYPSFINSEGLEIGSPGLYNDNPSLLFHSGYGFNPQMPYGPYSPVTTPLPSVGGDAQLYSPQQFPYTGPPYYHQLVPPSLPYLTSPASASQPELTNLVGVDRHGDSMILGPRPGYPSVGSFGRGNFPGAVGSFGFHDSQQGFDGPKSGGNGIWSDCSKPSERQMPLMPLSPAVSPQPIGSLGSFGQSVGMASNQQPLYGFGSGLNSYSRDYLPNQGSRFGASAISSFGANDRNWLSLENSRRRDRGASFCSCDGTPDILSEQNRGPRASKFKNHLSAENISVDNSKSKNSTSTRKFHNESFNRSDFITDYKDAKFFVIKSYSEDNVHKSIKYGVWASTPNGNRKLDAAYRQAKEKQDACPVFLFFSVNASAQFCGVAEMVGPVDFDKSVDYWQQDKWSGQFPVKWHIIKDVPNSQFRHIVLENNDNKPVTNSRDTQEVKLQQGIEILTIFKNYETEISILDDFDFYEDRQKAMQERKARQQASLMAIAAGGSENKSSANINGDFMKQMSKSFAQVVRLEEGNNEVAVTDRGSLTADGSNGTVVKAEDGIPVAATSVQTS